MNKSILIFTLILASTALYAKAKNTANKAPTNKAASSEAEIAKAKLQNALANFSAKNSAINQNNFKSFSGAGFSSNEGALKRPVMNTPSATAPSQR